MPETEENVVDRMYEVFLVRLNHEHNLAWARKPWAAGIGGGEREVETLAGPASLSLCWICPGLLFFAYRNNIMSTEKK